MSDLQQQSDWPAVRWPLTVAPIESADSSCSYFSDRSSRMRGIGCAALDAGVYQALMDAGCRRSGRVVYQPVCGGCRACQQYRVPTATFRMSKSQRRVWRKNHDVVVTIAPPEPTEEKWLMYRRYQQEWHEGKQSSDLADMVAFLYDSPTDTYEFVYRDQAGMLLGVGICDVTPVAISSVYFFFDPAFAARRVGTYSALYEITWARENGLPYWYAGYFINNCSKMVYKADFGPGEVLGGDGVWRPFTRSGPTSGDSRPDAA